jgi:[ribosomal protein S18]-alanine N-acetyltransferase
MTVTIDGLTKDDAERCAELEALLFPGDDPWPTVAFVRELDLSQIHIYEPTIPEHIG